MYLSTARTRMTESARFLSSVSLFVLAFCATGSASAQSDPEAFDGSFRLESGEVITGGYFVEEGRGRHVYMDTEGLERGGVFERVNDTLLRSSGMLADEGIEIEFLANADGKFDALVWRKPGDDPIRGRRIHPHDSRSVRFHSEDGTELQGRLLVPQCPGPHPVIVSVHGSGPVNRYGGPFHTFFLQQGMAVLAYDKRGYTPDPTAWHEPDFADLSADVAAAVRFVASQTEIDHERIGIFGSSQAGWTAPAAAVAAEETDFLIVRVGPAVTSFRTILHEVRQELRAEGMSGLNLDYAMDLRREIYELAMEGEPISATNELVAPYLDESWYVQAYGEGPISGRWSTRWWERAERNLTWTPAPALKRFAGPVLWFLAELDENVPLITTRAALERAFEAAPGDDHEIVVIEDAPHSFLIDTPKGPRYADGFFNYMANWLAERGYADASCWAED